MLVLGGFKMDERESKPLFMKCQHQRASLQLSTLAALAARFCLVLDLGLSLLFLVLPPHRCLVIQRKL